MKRLAQTLPEYAVVIEFRGVGEILAPQLIAEIGDTSRFPRKQSLVCFAGMEPENEQSGKFQANGRLSKKGSPRGVVRSAYRFRAEKRAKVSTLRNSAFFAKKQKELFGDIARRQA
jgi:transposase